MENLLYKTEKLRQEKKECLEKATGLKHFFICFPIILREFFCGFRYFFHFIKNTPYLGFRSISPKDQNGVWLVSYSSYLKYNKLGLSILFLGLLFLGIGTLFFITIHPNKVTAAPTPCSKPYTVYFVSPSTNQTKCVGDSFTLTGKWNDSDPLACPTAEPYTGKVNSTTISTSTPVKVSFGTYSGEQIEGLNFSKTVTANTKGTHSVKIQVDSLSGGFPISIYESVTRTITINDTPYSDSSVNLSYSNREVDSIEWSWEDNSSDEDNYRIMDLASNNISGDLNADSTSWTESSLLPNTQYTRYLQAENECGADNSTAKSVYTSIESPTGISFDLVGQNEITVSGEGTISNLSSGNSGIYFTESTTATNSDWLTTNTWEKSGLAANTEYTFDAKTRNGDSEENSAITGEIKYTLAADATVDADQTENVWTNENEIIFTNSAGFGAGGVEYYRYIFNNDSSYIFDNSETQWTSGTKALTASSDGSWYLHVKAFNGDDVAADTGATVSLGPFKIDTTPANIANMEVSKTINSAEITWITDEATTTQIAWGTTESYGNLTEEDVNLTTTHSVTLTGLDDNTVYYYKIMGEDRVGNVTASAGYTFTTAELEATVITDVSVSAISQTSAQITWTTNHSADSKVRYGLTTTYGSEVYSSALTTSHALTLTGLIPGTTYYYEVISTGNTTVYDAYATFTTEAEEEPEPELEPEPEPSSVYVASPTIVKTEVNPIEDGAIIYEVSPTITGLAQANNTIFIFIDGELENTVLSTDHSSGTGSFFYTLRRILPEGVHTLYTIARDADGNYSDSSPLITFTVIHPFVTPTLYQPVFTDGDNPEIIINGVARNDSLIKLYFNEECVSEYLVENNLDFENTYFKFSYPLAGLTEGNYILKVKAYSLSGQASKYSNAFSFEKKTSSVSDSDQFIFDEGFKYEVVSGDSLWKIAERFYGDGNQYTKIVEANKIIYSTLVTNPSLIQPGWQLIIP